MITIIGIEKGKRIIIVQGQTFQDEDSDDRTEMQWSPRCGR